MVPWAILMGKILRMAFHGLALIHGMCLAMVCQSVQAKLLLALVLMVCNMLMASLLFHLITAAEMALAEMALAAAFLMVHLIRLRL